MVVTSPRKRGRELNGKRRKEEEEEEEKRGDRVATCGGPNLVERTSVRDGFLSSNPRPGRHLTGSHLLYCIARNKIALFFFGLFGLSVKGQTGNPVMIERLSLSLSFSPFSEVK